MALITKLLIKLLWRQAIVIAKDEIANGFPRIQRVKFFLTTNVFLRSEEVRVSFAHLVNIHQYDKYLLVKSNRFEHYQPVGGVYKFNEASMKDRFTEKGIQRDNKMVIDKDSLGDIRLMVPAPELNWFIDWFIGGTNREITPLREFKEELIDDNILPSDFGLVDFEFERRIIYPLEWSKHFKCYELFIHDVYTPKFTPVQQDKINTLYNSGDGDLHKWATRDLIECLGYDQSTKTDKYRISKHSAALISSKI